MKAGVKGWKLKYFLFFTRFLKYKTIWTTFATQLMCFCVISFIYYNFVYSIYHQVPNLQNLFGADSDSIGRKEHLVFGVGERVAAFVQLRLFLYVGDEAAAALAPGRQEV